MCEKKNLLKNIDLEIKPYSDNLNTDQVKKLKLSPEQKSQISVFCQQIPNMISTNTLANTYVVKFPKGLPHTLTKLKQGGYGSMIKGNDGRFIASASFYPTELNVAALGIFSTMSVATGQYFMVQINNQLKIMNMKIGEIIDFLYGNKKAELIAEINFVKEAFNNYSSIMSHSEQRIATITGIQESKKTAMKGIEFYMDDLNSKTYSSTKIDKDKIDDMFKINESLELSMKLFAISSIMEIYYSQNFDKGYIESVKNMIESYIDKCDSRVLSCFSRLYGKLENTKNIPLIANSHNDLKTQLSEIISKKNNGEKSPLKQSVYDTFNSFNNKSEYIIDKNGDVYMRT